MSEVEKSDLDTTLVDSDAKQINKKGKLIDLRSGSEKTKAWIAKALVIIFGSTIACCFALVIVEIIFQGGKTEDWKDIVTLIIVAETGIVGTVIGFYFGEVSKS
ncbi:hypothetical protein [Chlorogloea sp. CCALA 695]|uniref:hypothetical protein n=1 Tax=Chlorogloea sp. CCALA 695 TaxID=2107693 RepID=UPI000D07B1A1|nr:hypothetical protein [Chlorogloea sp. CCALA 695]PSB31453.1 hypothetical protein C7B70_13190 [Chlorogloea sp. CCALA 695]